MIYLNKALFLTNGNPVGISALLSRLNPSSLSYTAVCAPFDDSCFFVSQVLHQPGSRSAHFSFLLPEFSEADANLDVLIDFLCFQAGEMGALNILAEVEESHPLFDVFRRAGFSVFSLESIWRLPGDYKVDQPNSSWQTPSATDENAIRSLFQTLVPPLVQNAEPFVNGGTPHLVYKSGGEVLAYVEILSGSKGIYLVPVIHPSVEDVQLLLLGLIEQFQMLGKPVYLQVRSYQAWLSDALQQIKAEASPRFALLVKHLAVGQLNALKQAQRVARRKSPG